MTVTDYRESNKILINNIKESLNLINTQKDFLCKYQQYEKAAILRNIEKNLIEFEQQLRNFRLPVYLDQYYNQPK